MVDSSPQIAHVNVGPVTIARIVTVGFRISKESLVRESSVVEEQR